MGYKTSQYCILHLSFAWNEIEPGIDILEGPANNSDFNSDDIPCNALERVNRLVPNIVVCI